MLYLKSFTFNPFQQNTYVLFDDERHAVFIDAGSSTTREHDALRSFVRDKSLTPERLLLTHAHIDHVMGCRFVHDEYGLLPEVHQEELYFIDNMMATARMYGVSCEQAPVPEKFLSEGQIICIGNHEFRCILAPGHSPGSICFYSEGSHLLLGGDVLFQGSIGRTDLHLGNHSQLLESIHKKLLILPPQTRVYSGHGPSTTIGEEKRSNPFLTGH